MSSSRRKKSKDTPREEEEEEEDGEEQQVVVDDDTDTDEEQRQEENSGSGSSSSNDSSVRIPGLRRVKKKKSGSKNRRSGGSGSSSQAVRRRLLEVLIPQGSSSSSSSSSSSGSGSSSSSSSSSNNGGDGSSSDDDDDDDDDSDSEEDDTDSDEEDDGEEVDSSSSPMSSSSSSTNRRGRRRRPIGGKRVGRGGGRGASASKSPRPGQGRSGGGNSSVKSRSNSRSRSTTGGGGGTGGVTTTILSRPPGVAPPRVIHQSGFGIAPDSLETLVAATTTTAGHRSKKNKKEKGKTGGVKLEEDEEDDDADTKKKSTTATFLPSYSSLHSKREKPSSKAPQQRVISHISLSPDLSLIALVVANHHVRIPYTVDLDAMEKMMKRTTPTTHRNENDDGRDDDDGFSFEFLSNRKRLKLKEAGPKSSIHGEPRLRPKLQVVGEEEQSSIDEDEDETKFFLRGDEGLDNNNNNDDDDDQDEEVTLVPVGIASEKKRLAILNEMAAAKQTKNKKAVRDAASVPCELYLLPAQEFGAMPDLRPPPPPTKSKDSDDAERAAARKEAKVAKSKEAATTRLMPAALRAMVNPTPPPQNPPPSDEEPKQPPETAPPSSLSAASNTATTTLSLFRSFYSATTSTSSLMTSQLPHTHTPYALAWTQEDPHFMVYTVPSLGCVTLISPIMGRRMVLVSSRGGGGGNEGDTNTKEEGKESHHPLLLPSFLPQKSFFFPQFPYVHAVIPTAVVACPYFYSLVLQPQACAEALGGGGGGRGAGTGGSAFASSCYQTPRSGEQTVAQTGINLKKKKPHFFAVGTTYNGVFILRVGEERQQEQVSRQEAGDSALPFSSSSSSSSFEFSLVMSLPTAGNRVPYFPISLITVYNKSHPFLDLELNFPPTTTRSKQVAMSEEAGAAAGGTLSAEPYQTAAQLMNLKNKKNRREEGRLEDGNGDGDVDSSPASSSASNLLLPPVPLRLMLAAKSPYNSAILLWNLCSGGTIQPPICVSLHEGLAPGPFTICATSPTKFLGIGPTINAFTPKLYRCIEFVGLKPTIGAGSGGGAGSSGAGVSGDLGFHCLVPLFMESVRIGPPPTASLFLGEECCPGNDVSGSDSGGDEAKGTNDTDNNKDRRGSSRSSRVRRRKNSRRPATRRKFPANDFVVIAFADGVVQLWQRRGATFFRPMNYGEVFGGGAEQTATGGGSAEIKVKQEDEPKIDTATTAASTATKEVEGQRQGQAESSISGIGAKRKRGCQPASKSASPIKDVKKEEDDDDEEDKKDTKPIAHARRLGGHYTPLSEKNTITSLDIRIVYPSPDVIREKIESTKMERTSQSSPEKKKNNRKSSRRGDKKNADDNVGKSVVLVDDAPSLSGSSWDDSSSSSSSTSSSSHSSRSCVKFPVTIRVACVHHSHHCSIVEFVVPVRFPI